MAHDNWETPPELLDVLDREFSFDLDAAASAENAICGPHITSEQDALVSPWIGSTVWCNPPYSRLPAFTARALSESRLHKNTVVLLIPAYTDTKWWRDHVLPAREIRFLVGRLRFRESGLPRDTARFPSALVIYHQIAGVSSRHPHVQWWDWRTNT